MLILKRNAKAFTLIELLVVITIIALLVSVLMPALNKARQSAKTVYCAAHQRAVGSAFIMYVNDNNGISHWGPNQGYWFEDGDSGKLLDKDAREAYWGIAYIKYADRDVFKCPSSRYQLQTWAQGDATEEQSWAHYGLNGFIAHRKVDRIRNTTETIVFQDHYESKLDNNEVKDTCQGTDMFYIPDGQSINLLQWRRSVSNHARHSILECFRHNRSNRKLGDTGDNSPKGTGVSNTLWLDGHVSQIAQSDGTDVLARWYTAGLGDGTKTNWVGWTKEEAMKKPVR